MTSVSIFYVFFVWIFGALIIQFLRKYNETALSVDEEVKIKEIREKFGLNWIWFAFIVAFNLPRIISKEFGLNNENLVYAFLICCVLVYLIFHHKKIRDVFIEERIPPEYIKLDTFYNNVTYLFNLAIGLFLLLA